MGGNTRGQAMKTAMEIFLKGLNHGKPPVQSILGGDGPLHEDNF